MPTLAQTLPWLRAPPECSNIHPHSDFGGSHVASQHPWALTGGVLGCRLQGEGGRAGPHTRCEGITGWGGRGGHGHGGVWLQERGGAESKPALRKPRGEGGPLGTALLLPMCSPLHGGGLSPALPPSHPTPLLIPLFIFLPASLFSSSFSAPGILSTPAKKKKNKGGMRGGGGKREKKINNRAKLRAVLADCSGRFVCSNPIVPGAAAQCSLRPQSAPDPRGSQDEWLQVPRWLGGEWGAEEGGDGGSPPPHADVSI